MCSHLINSCIISVDLMRHVNRPHSFGNKSIGTRDRTCYVRYRVVVFIHISRITKRNVYSRSISFSFHYLQYERHTSAVHAIRIYLSRTETKLREKGNFGYCRPQYLPFAYLFNEFRLKCYVKECYIK